VEPHVVAVGQPRRISWPGVAGTLAFVAVAAVALTWAKWNPYAHKLAGLRNTRTWPGSDILATAGEAEGAPSLHGAWTFTRAYGDAVWPALVAGLAIAAAVEALVPRRFLLRALARRTHARGSLAGGLASLPSLMCTCCTAPVAATLRRNGVPASSALAYWLGNPVLNPAVLAFLAIVAPWQWVATRLVAGIVLVFALTPLVARLADRGTAAVAIDLETLPAFRLSEAPRRFGRALARLAATLVPEYLVVVFALGLFRGWLFPLGGSAAHWGLLAVLVAALLGTLVVVPTGGEIPIVQGLAAAGVGLGVVGTLLITLPAISVVSMAMVVRAFSLRVTLAAAAAVAVTGLGAAGLLLVLTL
jgi:uncharacterized membrane protein YraQ (UPF0718 family)